MTKLQPSSSLQHSHPADRSGFPKSVTPRAGQGALRPSSRPAGILGAGVATWVALCPFQTRLGAYSQEYQTENVFSGKHRARRDALCDFPAPNPSRKEMAPRWHRAHLHPFMATTHHPNLIFTKSHISLTLLPKSPKLDQL